MCVILACGLYVALDIKLSFLMKHTVAVHIKYTKQQNFSCVISCSVSGAANLNLAYYLYFPLYPVS